MSSQLSLLSSREISAPVEVLYRKALISTCGNYRYSLTRSWRSTPLHRVAFVMLNPSTADALQDDPTVRKCMGFTKRFKFHEMVVFNLFAYRATDPSDLPEDKESCVGPENDAWIESIADNYDMVIAAWGTKGSKFSRDKEALSILNLSMDVYCLKKTKDGHPWHPLYVPYSAMPVLFSPKIKVQNG